MNIIIYEEMSRLTLDQVNGIALHALVTSLM